ncbi:hypothetical protein HA402_012614 [Bradysia odoriphaga]|nr:hypothetical protein HA402_012614 [Bradysia odoriphaga]
MGEMNPKFDTTSSVQPPTRNDSFSMSDYYSDNDNGNGIDYKEEAKISQYRRAIQLIDRKCELLSRNNEKLIRRIHFVKSISKRKEKDILLLKARLDEYNDEWRTADTTDTASNNFPSLIRTSGQNKSKKYTPRKYKKNTDNANSSKNDGVTTNGSAKDKESKPRKRQKTSKEPNAKRASNQQFIPPGVNQQQQ